MGTVCDAAHIGLEVFCRSISPAPLALMDKRLTLSILLIVGLATTFWTQSRVPQLNEKALMGGDVQLDALGFETVFEVQPDDPAIQKILYTTGNWLHTNKKGMAFGLLFAAALMLLLSRSKKRSFNNRFANSALGIAIGAPLGVCVNCAAPIAKGLHAGGARVETTLAAMLSSPTLNIIVLSMLFSLFPAYIVGIKLGLTIGFILIVLPLLARFFGKDVQKPSDSESCPLPLAEESNDTSSSGSWSSATRWVARGYAANLWYICKTTVPLMILAGFLGAILVTYLPWDSMATLLPEGSIFLVLAGMSAVALIGITLPVPIAFDVLVTAILLAGGMPVRYAMVLLFTLGIYSVYSMAIVWTGISRRLSVIVFVLLAGFGVVAGVLADGFHKLQLRAQQQMFLATFGETSEPRGPMSYRVGGDTLTVPPTPVAPLEREAVTTAQVPGLTIERIGFQDRVAEPGKPFRRLEGHMFGFNEPYSFSVMNFLSLQRFRGIASGDVHNDGWPDVVMTSDRGLSLYANQAGQRFARQAVDVPDLHDLRIVNAALVDLNNDGWLDIVFASYRKGNYVIYNRGGQFNQDQLRSLPNHAGAIMSGTMSFGDLDRDGDLDMAVGNWSIGQIGQVRGAVGGLSSSRNAVLINTGSDGFEVRDLPGAVGESLASLVSDLDNDGDLDLVMANDFTPPDTFYLGDGAGGLEQISRNDGVIPHSPITTMSITTADIDNDLTPEIYLGQITGRRGSGGIPLTPIGDEIAEEMIDPAYKKHCQHIMKVQEQLLRISGQQDMTITTTIDSRYREDSIALFLLYHATNWNPDRRLCDMFQGKWEPFNFACRQVFSDRIEQTKAEQEQSIRSQSGINVLLKSDGKGRFVDAAERLGVTVGGWTWNAKFADLDNDEWQDLFVVNGEFTTTTRESNIFYRNQGGQKFVDATSEYGLGSLLATSSYTYIDFDNDGDLDIIALPAVGPVLTFQNNLERGHSVAFELRDKKANRFGIGSKIIIHYGPDATRHQMREIQAGGGFVSFDAPMAWFGLGTHDRVASVEIQWSTGEKTALTHEFPAGSRYVITRNR